MSQRSGPSVSGTKSRFLQHNPVFHDLLGGEIAIDIDPRRTVASLRHQDGDKVAITGIDAAANTLTVGAQDTMVNGGLAYYEYSDPDTRIQKATDDEATISAVDADTEVWTLTGHGYSDDDIVRYTTTDATHDGLVADALYSVANKTTNTLKLTRNLWGGGAVTTTSSSLAAGTHKLLLCQSLEGRDDGATSAADVDMRGKYFTLVEIDSTTFKLEIDSSEVDLWSGGVSFPAGNHNLLTLGTDSVITTEPHGFEVGQFVRYSHTGGTQYDHIQFHDHDATKRVNTDEDLRIFEIKTVPSATSFTLKWPGAVLTETSNLDYGGFITFTTDVLPAGTHTFTRALNPKLVFTGDSDTGLESSVDNTIDVVCGGSLACTFGADESVFAGQKYDLSYQYSNSDIGVPAVRFRHDMRSAASGGRFPATIYPLSEFYTINDVAIQCRSAGWVGRPLMRLWGVSTVKQDTVMQFMKGGSMENNQVDITDGMSVTGVWNMGMVGYDYKDDDVTIASATVADPAVWTTGTHGYATNDIIRYIAPAGGAAHNGLVDGKWYHVTKISTTTFTLKGPFPDEDTTIATNSASPSGTHKFSKYGVTPLLDHGIHRSASDLPSATSDPCFMLRCFDTNFGGNIGFESGAANVRTMCGVGGFTCSAAGTEIHGDLCVSGNLFTADRAWNQTASTDKVMWDASGDNLAWGGPYSWNESQTFGYALYKASDAHIFYTGYGSAGSEVQRTSLYITNNKFDLEQTSGGSAEPTAYFLNSQIAFPGALSATAPTGPAVASIKAGEIRFSDDYIYVNTGEATGVGSGPAWKRAGLSVVP
jgi:hypothetical protein